MLVFRNHLVKGREKDGIVYFDNGLIYYLKNKAVSFYSFGDYKYKTPQSLFVFEDSSLKEIVYPNADIDFSVLIISDRDGYRCILLDKGLANSLFVRLYFFNGKGLKHFKPFTEIKDGDSYIRVFQIIWD